MKLFIKSLFTAPDNMTGSLGKVMYGTATLVFTFSYVIICGLLVYFKHDVNLVELGTGFGAGQGGITAAFAYVLKVGKDQ